MKHLAIAVILTFALSSIAVSQDSPFAKGSWTASGGFSYINYGVYHSTIITIDPTISCFVKPGFAVGLSFLLVDESNGSSYRGIGMGPSIRYYFDRKKENLKIKGSMHPYNGLALLFMNEQSSYYHSYYHETNSTTISFEWGFLTMISDNAGIFIEYEYRHKLFEGGDSRSINCVAAGFSYFIY